MSVRARALSVVAVVILTFVLRVAFALGGGDGIEWGESVTVSLGGGTGSALVVFLVARRRSDRGHVPRPALSLP